MKKFNRFESDLIIDSLHYYIANVESEILELQEKGKRCIFAPGFYTMAKNELVERVKDMTKKQKQYE